ncbi:SapC family protein [Ruegeria arenilitoris]|uniref:SapC family protein n=1 Tax=Ruegeria arenilitoris TaxID=1173585 RepID=UPI001479A66A|nr:SapC family protein [Ruegeria arenilitoris]
MAQNGPVPVTFDRHSDRSWHRSTSYDFARCRLECEIVSAEVSEAAAAFPIAFRSSGGGVSPHAILATAASPETPFVSDQGRWRATYVPSLLRCHPFSIELVGGEAGSRTSSGKLVVDETTGLVSCDQSGSPFFAKDGSISSELETLKGFLKSFLADRNATRRACALIKELGLFVELTRFKDAELPDGWMSVDFRRFNQLGPAQTAVLQSSGAMQLIYAHQVSLNHLLWIHHCQTHSPKVISTPANGRDSDLVRFLDAIAAERDLSDAEAKYACL